MMIRIREMKPEDVSAAAKIERQSFSEPWSEQAFLDALSNPQVFSLCACAVTDSAQKESVAEEKTAGYCVIYFAADEAEIATIAVGQSFRRRGIADALLNEVMRQMEKLGLRVLHLDVRLSNTAARALYEKHGFLPDGRRKNYYRDPREDALLMSLCLCERPDMK